MRQSCILSPTTANVFLKHIISGTINGFEGTGSIRCSLPTNRYFADDIDLVAGKVEDLIDLSWRLEESAKRLQEELEAEKYRKW